MADIKIWEIPEVSQGNVEWSMIRIFMHELDEEQVTFTKAEDLVVLLA